VRLRELACSVAELSPELEGLRVAHLSDLHLGVPSRGVHAVERAVAWVEERQPDLTCLTGDLLTRPAGEERLRRLVPRLPHCYAILGNHDLGIATDPLVERSALEELKPATLLRDDSRTLELRGRRVQVAGMDPRSRTPPEADGDADLRILLSHYPQVIDRLEPGAFHIVLAGHMHAGQIVLPYVAGKLRFAHLTERLAEGIYRREAGTLHVSPGLGTTFVPLRFFARPEATELVLERAA
jgi:predicted MPP superfamily phosphohydrolase